MHIVQVSVRDKSLYMHSCLSSYFKHLETVVVQTVKSRKNPMTARVPKQVVGGWVSLQPLMRAAVCLV